MSYTCLLHLLWIVCTAVAFASVLNTSFLQFSFACCFQLVSSPLSQYLFYFYEFF